MRATEAPTSDSYHDYLISSLQDPEEAAMYLEVHLEEDEDATPELLKLALSNVFEALSQSKLSPEQSALHHQKLDEILAQPGSEAIYGLANWLNDLGLKLTVTVADQEQE